MKPKIIYHKDFSRPGNDCNINESISVVKEFGTRTYRHRRVVSGWSPEDFSYETTDKDEFVRHLKNDVFVAASVMDEIFEKLDELNARRW